MNAIVKRWIIGICIGVCITGTIYFGHTYIHRNDKYARVAKLVGVDVTTWADLNRLYDKAANQHTLTSNEVDQEQAWLSHTNRSVRLRALVSLRYCTDPVVQPRAIALIRTRLDDEDPAMRMKAITSLKMVNDPNLAADVGRFTSDPAEIVRASAKEALAEAPAGSKPQ